MSVGAFTDKKQRPSDEEVRQAIGAMWAAWQELVHFIREDYPADEDFKFMYGKNYGWALRFRMRGKLLTSLYPREGGFTVQINLGPGAVEQALQIGLGENALGAIARAHPYPEGRWVFIPVGPTDDIGEIHRVLALRAATKKLS